MESMIHIGADVKKGSVKKVNKMILAILNTSAGDDVKRTALGVIGKLWNVRNVTIEGCTINAGGE